MVVTSTAQGTRDSNWITRHFSPEHHVTLTDITSSFAVLSVMGPKSRELLQRVSRTDWSNEAFPFSTSQMVDIGYSSVRASRITYVGELGWELYIPTDFAVAVYELLHEAAKGNEKEQSDLKLTDAGYYAIDSLR